MRGKKKRGNDDAQLDMIHQSDVERFARRVAFHLTHKFFFFFFVFTWLGGIEIHKFYVYMSITKVFMRMLGENGDGRKVLDMDLYICV